MKVVYEQFIIMLKDKFADQRILDKDGYLVGSIRLAKMYDDKEHALEVLAELDEPYEFEVVKVEITYEI